MTIKTNAILKSMGLEELKRLAKEKKRNQEKLVAQSDPERRQFPLTDGQKSIWALEKLLPGNKAYNNPLAITCYIEHEFDADKVEYTLRKMTQQHDIFRTTIQLVDGQPQQCIGDKVLFNFKFDDISHLPEQEKQQWVLTTARQEGLQEFSLEHGPLFSWRMSKTHANEYIIMLTFHHIISDGWTVSLCFKEFMSLYFGQPTTSAAQFKDYALEENQKLDEGYYNESIEFWTTKLKGTEGKLDLATDFPRPAYPGFQGSYVHNTLTAKDNHKMIEFAAKHGTPPFHVILTAYQILLHKYSGQNDIIIGIPFANRNDTRTQTMMGLFMNTLPLRFQLDSNQSLQMILAKTKSEAEQAAQHQNIALNRIIENIDYDRDPSINPLYQVALTYQVYPHSRTNQLFSYSPLKVDYGVAKLDLNLWVEEDGDELLFTLNFDSQLFKPQTAQRIIDDLHIALPTMIEQSESKLKDVSLVKPEQRNQLLKTSDVFTHQQATPFHQWFEKVAQDFPHQTAVQCQKRKLTYQELDKKATLIAQYLLDQGLNLAEPVAVLMKKSEHTLATMLGILKAGGCYLPIDIKSPSAYVEFILNDTKVKHVLLLGKSPNKFQLLANNSSQQWTDILKINTFDTIKKQHPLPQVDGERPAYIIYTSGSTGTPKGVRILHRNLIAYCDAIKPVLKLKAGSRYGVISSFSTDLAHTMIFPALMTGGEIIIFTDEQIENPNSLFNACKNASLDTLKITPTHLNALLHSKEVQYLIPNKVLVLGGEPLQISLVERIRDLNPDLRIINHYGPTESTVGVSTYELPFDLTHLDSHIAPIGKALKGNQLLILDSHQQLQPRGLPGEICISGQQLCLGYLNNSNKNQRHFVPHPYVDGAILYRTGDKGRIRDDGNIEYLDRLDRQCKIRGYRVELATIEQTLNQIDGVAQSAVIVKGNQHTQQLVAFICTQDNLLDQHSIKAILSQQLPHYMIPDVWVMIEQIPLTASGKINYQALKVPTPAHVSLSHVQPQNATQRELELLFKKALKKDQVSLEGSFLDQGGNSISGLSLVIDINSKFSTSITLGQILESGNIIQLSQLIDQQFTNSESANRTLITLKKREGHSTATTVLVHPAGGNVACYQPLIDSLNPSQSVYGIQVTDFGQVAKYNYQVEDLAAHYIEQMGPLAAESSLILGGWSLGATLAFEMAYQIDQQYGNQPTVLVLDQPAPSITIDHSADMSESERLTYFASKVEQYAGTPFNITNDQLVNMTPMERSALFLSAFQKSHLVPDNITAQDFQYFLAILQAHLHATDRYQGRIYRGKVIVVEAQDILQGRIKQAQAGLGWQHYTQKPVSLFTTQGDHISIMTPPFVSGLAKQLKEVIA
ncbi:amino acid adenylation domain-containing protein [Vibrio caribbeanicus]|uniref:amino acid adenylation domain-containing protein n=1 Tax=Vibrio caribbeanicus TaxID=701175 RepID=UPI0030DBD5A5